MKKVFSKTAFTLIELIVSSLLVAIVTLGIFSINMVLNNNSQDYGQKYLVKATTQTTLNHILNNAALAYGSANPNDEGIILGPTVGDTNTFCIHQLANNNLINNAADIWLCYTWLPGTYSIEWCAETYGSGSDPRGATGCTNPLGHFIQVGTFLGSAYSVTPSYTATATQLLFSVNILNCLNNSLGSCSAAGPSGDTDPTDNPEVQLNGSIIPLQVST